MIKLWETETDKPRPEYKAARCFTTSDEKLQEVFEGKGKAKGKVTNKFQKGKGKGKGKGKPNLIWNPWTKPKLKSEGQ